MATISPEKLAIIVDTPIEKLSLRDKTYVCVKQANINKVGDLLKMNDASLLAMFRNDAFALDDLKIKLKSYVEGLNSIPDLQMEMETKEPQSETLPDEDAHDFNDDQEGKITESSSINCGTDPIRDKSEDAEQPDPLNTSILDLEISSKAFYALRFSHLETIREIISYDKYDLKRKYRRLDEEKVTEIKCAIKAFADKKGFAEELEQYPLFSMDIQKKKVFTAGNISGSEMNVDKREENNTLIITKDWTDDELAREYGQLYYRIQELLKEEYDDGSLWISITELQTKLGEQFPFLIEQIRDKSKVRTILDNASWATSASVFYCWKPTEYLKPQENDIGMFANEAGEHDVFEGPPDQANETLEIDTGSDNAYQEEPEIEDTDGTAIEEDHFVEDDVINNDHEQVQNLSLEECIRTILVQRKSSGREWITAMTVYDTLKDMYPSVAESNELIDIREILTTSTWIEKDDFYYRITDSAFADANIITQTRSTDDPLPAVAISEESEASNEVSADDQFEADVLTDGELATAAVETEEEIEPETLAGDTSPERLSAVRVIPIEELGLSVRAYNCLKRVNINTIGDLVKITPDDLSRIRNLGEMSSREVRNNLKEFLLHFDEVAFFNDSSIDYSRLMKEEEDVPITKKVIRGTIIYDIPIRQLGLSVRASNCLERVGIRNVSEILYWDREDLLKLRNMGVGSANEILHKIEELYASGQIVAAATEEEMQIARAEYYSSEDFRNGVIKAISMLLNGAGYQGITIGDITKEFSEDVEEEYLLPIIEEMMHEGSVVCINGYYRKVFPSILDAIKVLPDDHQQFIRDRLEGKTLEEIGNYAGVTRERVRQVVAKDIRALKEGNKNVDPVYFFSEDEYRYIYQNYYISRSEWLSAIGKPEYIFNYLQTAYKRGGRPLSLALEDPLIDEDIKRSIQARDDENYIVIGNKRILKARKEIEDYVIYHYFKEGGTVDEFYDTYNSFLEECGIEDIGLYATDDVKRTRENRLSDSRKVLWKQNRRLRYYDIDGTDFDELFDTLDLHQYDNVELSTYKFVRDYPELMDEYDIRDEYELHNLLKKICDPNEYPSVQFGRMPGIVFGQFNRDDAVKEMLFDLAPISQDDLAEALCEKYGFKVPTIKANWLDCIDEYYFNGEYHVENEDEKTLSEEQLQQLTELLSGDFYLTDEVARIYARVTGERQSPRAYVLKRMGFKVYSDYIFRGAGTANEFFLNLLTKDDIVDLGTYGSKLRYLVTFNMVEHALREEYEILEFEPHKYVNIRRLASFDLDKSDVIAYCNEVKRFVGEDGYFTIPWLRSQGFTSKLDDLGFEDFFYEAILAMDPGIYSFIQRSDKRRGSALLKVGDSLGSKSDFLVRLIEREGSIDKDELISYCRNNYNIELTDNSIYHAVEDSDVYYDSIMGKYYANYSLYFEEI